MQGIILIILCLMGNVAYCAHAYQLSIAAIFQNEGPYLKEWIEYHKMVGVEHFWLYNDKSDDNYLEVLQPYIARGVVELIDWPTPNFIAFIRYQNLAYRDALERTKGITKWLALIDLDEYLLPVFESTIIECLDKHFRDAAGVYVNWHHFGTGGVHLRPGESILFGLTACSNKFHSSNSIGKSIIQPAYVEVNWNPHHFVLKSPGKYYNGDAQPLEYLQGDLYSNVFRDLKLDGMVHNKFIRLNHYQLRDENFFHNVRLVRTRGLLIEDELVWEHYRAFNEEQDHTIIHFILEHHSNMYESYWKNHIHTEH